MPTMVLDREQLDILDRQEDERQKQFAPEQSSVSKQLADVRNKAPEGAQDRAQLHAVAENNFKANWAPIIEQKRMRELVDGLEPVIRTGLNETEDHRLTYLLDKARNHIATAEDLDEIYQYYILPARQIGKPEIDPQELANARAIVERANNFNPQDIGRYLPEDSRRLLYEIQTLPLDKVELRHAKILDALAGILENNKQRKQNELTEQTAEKVA